MPKNVLTSKQLHTLELLDELLACGVRQQAVIEESGLQQAVVHQMTKRNISYINDANCERVMNAIQKISAKIAKIEMKRRNSKYISLNT